MPLKKSAGNMYPWVTHTHSHLAGKCPHECAYCYVQAMERRFQWGRYAGALRLDRSELGVQYGEGRTIFIEHMNDLFAAGVETDWIADIIGHCRLYPSNIYVLQTKNPARMALWWQQLPIGAMFGTTIEATRELPGSAPSPGERAVGMVVLRKMLPGATLFVTIEPIQEPFDLFVMLDWLKKIRPAFVNIGADSKGHGLTEPAADKIRALVAGVEALGIEIRQKRNLDRLLRDCR